MPNNKVSINTFKTLLNTADLIVVDGSPYLHTWDYNDSSFISTKYEEEGSIYEIDIPEEDIQDIKKQGVNYIITCNKTKYTVNLYTLKFL